MARMMYQERFFNKLVTLAGNTEATGVQTR